MGDTTRILLAIIGTGVAVLGFLWRLDARMGAMEHRLNARIDSLEGRMNSRIDAGCQVRFSHKDSRRLSSGESPPWPGPQGL